MIDCVRSRSSEHRRFKSSARVSSTYLLNKPGQASSGGSSQLHENVGRVRVENIVVCCLGDAPEPARKCESCFTDSLVDRSSLQTGSAHQPPLPFATISSEWGGGLERLVRRGRAAFLLPATRRRNVKTETREVREAAERGSRPPGAAWGAIVVCLGKNLGWISEMH